MKYLLHSAVLSLCCIAASCSSDSGDDPGGAAGRGGAGAGGKPGASGGTSPGSGGLAGKAGSSSTAGSGGSSPASGGAGGSNSEAGAGGSAGSVSQISCGTGKAKVPTGGSDSAEGVVIAPDGTIYHSQSFSGTHIGRIRPGMDPEKTWVSVGNQVLGVTYDPKRKVLYAGSRGRQKILKIQVDAENPEAEELCDAESGVNGLTLGEDDAVYYNDQTGGHVYRVTAEGDKTTVTKSPMPNGPNGLAFGPDGWLYINQWEGSEVWRLKLDESGKETERERFIEKVGEAKDGNGAKNGDGIAFDELGRIYITASGQLHQHDKDGKWLSSTPSNGANLDFGVGALSCTDVYVGGNGNGLKIHTLDAKGMDVPWHRAPN